MASFETGYRSTLAAKLNSTDITLDVVTAPTVTAGRMHIYKGATHAWIEYTGVTGNTLTGVTFVSQTADPATSVTGTPFPAGTSIELVAMHDQIIDKQNGSTVKVYANTAARDADLTSPSNGMACYVTADGTFYDYVGGAWTTRASGSVANASTTVAGKVEIATDSEIIEKTDTGGTGATLTITPSQLQTLGRFGSGSDGDVTISVNTTLTSDMNYNNLTVNTGVTVNPAGYQIFVLGTLTLTGTAKILRTGTAGSAGSGATGGAGGTALQNGTCGKNVAGVAGANGIIGVGATGTTGTAANPSYATTSTTGATGGTGATTTSGTAGGTGGTGGTATQGKLYNKVWNLWEMLSYFSSPGKGIEPYSGMPSGGGGGAGGGDTGTSGAGGGGSGSSGGNIIVAANTLAGTGTIESIGGVGGAGGTSISANQGCGGGGAGGSGGIVVLIYRTGTPYTIVLTGGAGGAIGGGTRTLGATAGATGTTGQSILINV